MTSAPASSQSRSMRVRVRLFASLREVAGVSDADLAALRGKKIIA